MAHSIADRISEAAARAFVGRRRELGALDRAVGADGSVVLAFVHGPGGIGKTCLVDEALRRAPPGVRVLRLDCRQVEPTARGLLAAVWAALGGDGEPPGLDAVAGSLRGEPGRTVLVLDNYEAFGLLDAWVRQEFLPALPDRVAAVISGRDPPAAGWLTAPGWAALVERVEVRGLRQSEALELLRLRGLSELQAARVNAFARGHPLALELAAATPAADRDLALEGDPPPEVLGHLVEAFVAQLPAETLRVVEAASTVRRVDEPILRALLDEPSARDAFEALRRLPFAESTAEGLALHDVVRDAVARDLALRDPEAHAGYRRRAFELFVRRVTRVGSEVPWTATADLVFLIRNPLLRDCCFPPAAREYVVEPATAQDGAAIRRIAAALGAGGGRGAAAGVARPPPGDLLRGPRTRRRGRLHLPGRRRRRRPGPARRRPGGRPLDRAPARPPAALRRAGAAAAPLARARERRGALGAAWARAGST